MTFTLYKASDYTFRETITVNTLEDLKNIYCSIIVDFEDMTITIYDDYVE